MLQIAKVTANTFIKRQIEHFAEIINLWMKNL